jgi:hypothetical protein
MAAGSNPPEAALAAALPGTWRLVSRQDRTASGERRVEPSLGEDPEALLFYDRAGHFAAQFMRRDRAAPLPEPGVGAANNSRAQAGYDAYFGTYTIDDGDGTVTHRLVGALSPENVGLALARTLTVEADVLTIRLATTSPQGEPVVRTLVWTRVG